MAKSAAAQFTFLGSNRVFAPNASATVSYAGKSFKDVASWVAAGLDRGTSIEDSAALSSADIIAMGKQVLVAPVGPTEPPTAIARAAIEGSGGS